MQMQLRGARLNPRVRVQYVDGYMMFWILSLYHLPLCMYSTDEELRAISIAGVQLFHKSQQRDNACDKEAPAE